MAARMTLLLASAPSDLFGTIPGWLTLAAVAALAWYLRGGASGQAIEILRDQRDVLAGRVTELETTNAALTKRVAELEGKTDVALAISPALLPLVQSLHKHEDNAAKRTHATLKVLDMIAERLGPDTN